MNESKLIDKISANQQTGNENVFWVMHLVSRQVSWTVLVSWHQTETVRARPRPRWKEWSTRPRSLSRQTVLVSWHQTETVRVRPRPRWKEWSTRPRSLSRQTVLVSWHQTETVRARPKRKEWSTQSRSLSRQQRSRSNQDQDSENNVSWVFKNETVLETFLSLAPVDNKTMSTRASFIHKVNLAKFSKIHRVARLCKHKDFVSRQCWYLTKKAIMLRCTIHNIATQTAAKMMCSMYS